MKHDFAAASDAALYFAHNGYQSVIADLLEPHRSTASQLNAEDNRKLQLLLAWGLISSRRFTDVENILDQYMGSNPNDPDCRLLEIGKKYALREYEAVVDLAASYLKKLGDRRENARPDRLFAAPAFRAQILEWYGEALAQCEQDENALLAFLQAVDCAPDNQNAYIGLVRTLVRLNRRDEASQWIASGIERCADHQELTMLREYLLERPRISACMIVKNEERLLPECLESIRDWVDEIIVVDTGSTDKTQAIAEEFGAKVFEQAWAGDFSRHRNYSIEQATGDWIFIIDADERFVVDDVPAVIDVMREGRVAALSVGVYNVYGHDAERVTFANSIRFFKRELNLRYAGIVHNALALPSGLAIGRTRARIEHLGYDLPPEQMAAKFQRTRALLQKQLTENPDDTFALFNYAELLRGVEPILSDENAGEIIQAAENVVRLIPEENIEQRHLRLMALNQLAVAYLARKDFSNAVEYCRRALSLRSNYLDALFNSGLALYGLRNYRAAIVQFEAYLKFQSTFDIAAEEMPLILSFPDASDLAHNSLGALYELVGEPDNAISHYLRVMQKNPRFRETAVRLAQLYAVRQDFKSAERWFGHQLSFRPTRDAFLGMASVLFETGRFDQAESHYRQAIAQFGACWSAENDLGNSLYKQGRFGDAEQHYLRAAELSPNEPKTFQNLALAQIAQGRRREAIATLEHYIEVCPTDPVGWQLMAEQLLASGNWPEAQACFENTLRLSSRNVTALAGLADCYLNMGQADAAAFGYRKLLEIDPNNTRAQERLAAIEEVADRFQGR